MILKFEIYARKLDRNIPIHLYLPDNYMDEHEDYPVLYMFDGHNLFFDEDATYGRSWRLISHLEALEENQMIVVGIESSHEGNDRLAEYAPFPFYDEEFGYLPAYGAQTMHFIIHDLKPFIDTHYPTIRDRAHTWIGGSSCGGLMALYGLYKYSNVFSKGLAISPYILASQSAIIADIARTFVRRPSSLYISWGAREGHTGHEFVEETKVITQVSNVLLSKSVRLHFNVKVYGEHTEASWEAEADDFLRFLLS